MVSDTGERLQKAEDALYAALRTRGHAVEAGTAVVLGERIDFKLIPGPLGKPTLIAKPADRHGGDERRWPDNGRWLKGQMDRIVRRFEAIAQRAIDNRARDEQASREFKDTVRRAAARLQRERAEAERSKTLRALAARWEETARLRAFLDAAEARIAPEPAPGALAVWLEWARAYVDAFDPLSIASLEGLRTQTEALMLLPEDDGEWDEDEQYWRDMGWLDDLKWLDERG